MAASKRNGTSLNGKISTRPVQRFGWVPDLPDFRRDPPVTSRNNAAQQSHDTPRMCRAEWPGVR